MAVWPATATGVLRCAAPLPSSVPQLCSVLRCWVRLWLGAGLGVTVIAGANEGLQMFLGSREVPNTTRASPIPTDSPQSPNSLGSSQPTSALGCETTNALRSVQKCGQSEQWCRERASRAMRYALPGSAATFTKYILSPCCMRAHNCSASRSACVDSFLILAMHVCIHS